MERAARLPVLSCAEAAAAESAWIAGDARRSLDLMLLAAAQLAAGCAGLLRRPARRVLVLAGKGHNGADAILAASVFADAGAEVTVVFAQGAPKAGHPATIWRRCGRAMRVAPAAALPRLARRPFCLILDGLLGQGFRGRLSADLADCLRASEALQGWRVAIDLPTGLGDDATGPAFRADITFSLGCLKRPLLAPRARRFVGRLRVLDLGLPFPPTAESCATPAVLAPLRRPRAADTDKRRQGRLLIVGGSDAFPGAVLMNTMAALRAGAGLVTTALPRALAPRAAPAMPEAMWRGLATDRRGVLAPASFAELRPALANKDALLAGSGMGPDSASFLRRLVRAYAGPLVLDADALRPDLVAAARRTAPLVLLPHAGEFKRLAGRPMHPAAGRAYARAHGAIVVLKGPVTCVTDGRRTVHLPFGGPVLARGGSGDLLAGVVAAVLARRAALGLAPFEAVVMAAAWHARAADVLGASSGEEAVRSTDLLDGLSAALLD
jgi:NAD(P)H-hydrate epimerase